MSADRANRGPWRDNSLLGAAASKAGSGAVALGADLGVSVIWGWGRKTWVHWGVFLLPVVAFSLCLLLFSLYAWMNDLGWGLLSAYRTSDAELYLYHAWFRAFVGPDGFLESVIPPSTYVFLASWAFRLGGPDLWPLLILHGFLFSLIGVFMALATRRLFGSGAALVVVGLFCFCGLFLFHAGLTMKTVVVMALVSGALYFASLIGDTRMKWCGVVGLAVFSLLLAIERNNFILLLLILPLLPLFAAGFGAGSRRIAIGVFCLPLLAFLGLTLSVDRGPAHSPAALNLYIGNSAAASGAYVPVFGIRNDLIGHHIDLPPDAREGESANRYWFRRTMEAFQQAPGAVIAVQFQKMGMMLARQVPGSPEHHARAARFDSVLASLRVDHGVVLALLVAAYMLGDGRRRRTAIALGLAALLYGATVVIFFVHERYRIPFLLMLLPVAAYGLMCLLHAGRAWVIDGLQQRRARVAFPLALILGGLVFLLSDQLTRLAPVGPGWEADWEQAELMESRQQERARFLVNTLFLAAAEGHARDWDRLAHMTATRGLQGDADRFRRKAARALLEAEKDGVHE